MSDFILKNPLFKASDRRFRVLRWTPELFFNWRINPLVTKLGADGQPDRIQAIGVKGLPDDTTIEALSYEAHSNHILMRIHSATFSEAGPACFLPELDVTFTAWDLAVRREPRADGLPGDELIVDLPTFVGA